MPTRRRGRLARRIGPALALTLAAAAWCGASGCSTTDLGPVYRPHRLGKFDAAADGTRRLAPRRDADGAIAKRPYKKYDEFWVAIERGKVLQDAGRFRESAEAFNIALDILQALDFAPEVRLADAANSVQAILSDERQRDYPITFYDTILIETAQTLNYAMLGDLETAAVFARRQLERQEEQAARREALQEALEAYNDAAVGTGAGLGAGGASLDRVQQLPEYQRQLRRLEGLALRGESEVLVPYGYYLGSVVMRASGRPGEALEFSRRLQTFRPGLEVSRLTDVRDLEDKVYVIFENGLAPERESIEERIGLIGDVVALPVLRVRDASRAARLRLLTEDGRFITSPIGSVDAIVALDFRERLPVIWGRPILSALLKLTATEVTARAVTDREDVLLRSGIRIAGLIWTLLADPDLRTWATLPGEHQVTEFPRPRSGVVSLEVLSGPARVGARETVSLPGRGPVLLFVRSTSYANVAAYAVSLGPPPGPREARRSQRP